MNLKISRILHAGYVFEYGKTQIAFDPIFENPFSRNCYAFPPVKFDHDHIQGINFSAVFISHFHDDHCSFESLNNLSREIPIYMYCVFPEMFTWLQELGFKEVHSINLNEPIQIGEITVLPRRALDEDVDSIFHIKAGPWNVLNVVDSWIDYETLNLLSATSWDMVLWPFQTMRELEVLSPLRAQPSTKELPSEWKEQLKKLNPQFVVPSSCQFIHEPWSWYNQAFFPISYADFEKQIQGILSNSKVIRMNPGVSVNLTSSGVASAAPLPWIVPLGEQNVDYEYNAGLVPPAMSEVAKNFSALTTEQADKVLTYCRQGLVEKYGALDHSEKNYFSAVRHWQLKVYDHLGQSFEFSYLIEGTRIELIKSSDCLLGWLTEVSIFKLHAALESGESLTSMYLRINDMFFNPQIEKQLQEVDLVEDPLVRCLFNQAFGSYQLAQLNRLK